MTHIWIPVRQHDGELVALVKLKTSPDQLKWNEVNHVLNNNQHAYSVLPIAWCNRLKRINKQCQELGFNDVKLSANTMPHAQAETTVEMCLIPVIYER